jgi:hypothetical protein
LDNQIEISEASVPFTNFQIEDAIFIDENHVLALEYAKFHKDNKSDQVDKQEPNYQGLDLVKDEQNRSIMEASFSSYLKEQVLGAKGEKMDSIFDQDKFQKFIPNSSKSFIDREKGNCQECDVCMIFAYLSMYDINEEGQIKKGHQFHIHLDI